MKLDKKWILFIGMICFIPFLSADVERKEVEIPGKIAKQIEQVQQSPSPHPVQEVTEPSIPEIPQPLKERKLSPAEQEQINRLEHEFAEGKITQTEYDLEKDRIVRRPNIKF